MGEAKQTPNEAGFATVQTSGADRQFSTGAHRDAAGGKGRFDLLPVYALMRLAKHYENGSVRHGDRNWERGMPLSSYTDSAFRHLVKFMDGSRDEDHLAAVLWNVSGYLWTEREIREGRLPDDLADVPWPDSTEKKE